MQNTAISFPFIWNFHIKVSDFKQSNLFSSETSEKIAKENKSKWEARFFFPIETPIFLNWPHSLPFSFYFAKAKTHEDTYIIHPEQVINLKKRRTDIYYKPLIEKKQDLFYFGKKEIIDEKNPIILSQTTQLDITRIQNESALIALTKNVLKFNYDHPMTCQLEFGSFTFQEKIYSTFGIESKSFEAVSTLSSFILPNEKKTDYINFLKENLFPS